MKPPWVEVGSHITNEEQTILTHDSQPTAVRLPVRKRVSNVNSIRVSKHWLKIALKLKIAAAAMLVLGLVMQSRSHL